MKSAITHLRQYQFWLLFIALILVVPLLAFTITLLYTPKVEQEAYANLEAITRLKSGQIENWIAERYGDANALAGNDGFTQLVLDSMQQTNASKRPHRIQHFFEKLRIPYGYDSILLLDSSGQIMASLGESTGLLPNSQALLSQVFNNKQVQFSDLYLDKSGHTRLDWVVPIWDADHQKPIAAVFLRVDPEQFLYPLIQTWPTASTSAESLLVRREDNSVLFLNNLRHRKDTALTFRLPLSATDLPAAIALRNGKAGTTSGIDHRGVQVLAAYQPIASTEWYIIAKIDRDELMAPLKDLIFWVSLVAFISISIIGVTLLVLWRQQQRMQNLILANVDTSLKDSQALTQSLVDAALDAVISINQEGKIIRWNAQAEHVFGYSYEQVYGRELAELIVPPEHRDAHRQGIARFINNHTSAIIGKRIEISGLRADGTKFPMELTISALNQRGKYFFSAYVRDLTKRKQAEASRRIAAIAFESLEGMMITDANSVILKVNEAFVQITGFSADEVIGKKPSVLRSDRHDEKFYQAMWLDLNQHRFWRGEVWNRRKTGEIYPEMLRITAVTDKNGQVTNYVAAFSDISERKKIAETINTLAFYDPLTLLPNRRLMLDRLQQMLQLNERDAEYGAVLSIDLDNFKSLNDTKGHETGDQMLIEVARRLQSCVHTEDTVSRIGGDEFVVLLSSLSTEGDQAVVQAENVAERIRRALSLPFNLQGHEFHSSVTIGICLFHKNEISADEIFKHADSALHQAKQSERNSIRFFDPGTQAILESRLRLETWMHNAFPQQFILYYQSQVDNSGHIHGAETLIRWQHPEKGLISPAMFIPLAEETGLILPIGDWVLETACKQLKAWESDPKLRHLQLAVNVSAKQFHQRDFVEKLLATLERTGADPVKLKLELTESLLVNDVEAVVAKMAALKTKGISFSLDDFGTGFSSLSYLKRLPLDQLKIDQSFVQNVLSDANDAAIVRTVIALGQSMGLAVIAEGVEKETQRDFLAVHGCNHFQGYLFSKPVPLETFELLLKSG